ncbi:PNPLA domain-containing protein [Vibrio chagasii]|nr:PNPLA domain-containing protein [Vibrio chagasii]
MMESYAVFEGGGVKGAAFAGALKAAEEANIKFVGYGGASAGSIVAFLAALGFNAEEIKRKMFEIDFIKLLDEPIKDEANILRELFTPIKQNTKLTICLIATKLIFNKKHRSVLINLIKRIFSDNGAYRKRNITSLMSYYAYQKFPHLVKACDTSDELMMTFADFYEETKIDFRVIATNVATGEAHEFSHIKDGNMCVFEAIAASSAYPLVFKPTLTTDGTLVDGGLSCNLPTYLFHGHEYKKLPIYAFDLQKEKVSKVDTTKNWGIAEHIGGLVNSALDASNNIISDVVGGIAVPVVVPNDISTLDFNIGQDGIDRLYNSGYQSAHNFFSKHQITKWLQEAKSDEDIARLLYGDFDFLLGLLVDSLPEEDCAVKAWLYTSVNADTKKILTFSKASNLDDATPNYHEFEMSDSNIDCIECWKDIDVKLSYDAKKDKTRICFPITSSTLDELSEMGKQGTSKNKGMLAVLCLSMDSNYTNCIWLDRQLYISANPNVDAFDISPAIGIIVHRFCDIIRRSMLGNQASFHSKKGETNEE